MRIFNDVQQAKRAVAMIKLEFQRKKDTSKFSSQSIVQPSCHFDLRNMGRSTFTVTGLPTAMVSLQHAMVNPEMLQCYA